MTLTLPVLSADQVRAAEQRHPHLLADGTLMQRAAFAVATECIDVLHRTGAIPGRHVLLLVGAGDNGGDALFAGAFLARRGAAVFALPLGDRMHEGGLQALRAAGGRVVDAEGALALFDRLDLVVDGIVGLGSSRPLDGLAALMARAIADAQLFTVAVDVPSGVHTDTGAVPGVAVHADLTVTFGALRRAHLVTPAALRCGEVRVADIGVAMDGPDRAVLDEGSWFAPPAADADKYARGVVGVVTGSSRYPGAAILSTGAALRSGCGLVRYFGGARASVSLPHPEVVAASDEGIGNARCQAWAVGSGGGLDEEALEALVAVLMHDAPAVVDADALTLIARDRHLQELVRARAARGLLTLLTPHTGELERLASGLGLLVDVEADRVGAARAVAQALAAVVLFKGPATIVTDGTDFVVTPLLGAQLATAGSGDVLAGLLGGALARWSAPRKLEVPELMELAAACAIRHAAAARDSDTVASDLVVGLEAAQSATMTP